MSTSIADSEGIKAVKIYLENFPRRIVTTKVITTLLSLILTLNYFVFNCKNYIPIEGCAMGIISAPAYANIFMDHFERKYIYPFLERFSLSYLRFIDDTLFTWTGSKDQLITLSNDLNTKNNSIKFEYKISQSNIPFLDAEAYIKNKNYTQRFIGKEIDREYFLHINSKHLISLKNNIPYSQVLRVEHTRSTIKNFKLYCAEFKEKFIEKGYKSVLLDKHISTVEKLDGNKMSKEKVRKKQKQTCIPLTLTYNRFCLNISKVIRKYWNLLEINECLKEILNCQSITAFRPNKNLKELIGSDKIEKNKVKKKTITEIKTRQMLSMPGKFKVTLLQASTKNNYF